MFVYFRKIWVSIVFLIILFSIQQFQLSLIGFAVLCFLSGSYITYILRHKLIYKRANEKRIKDLNSFSHIESTEHLIFPFMETIIITALVNLCYFVSSPTVSVIMFAAGSIYLLLAHFVKNKEEYYFYTENLI